MESFLAASGPASRAVLEALLNGVWQGVALAAATALLLRLLPRANAATRHLVWCGALGAVAVLPVLALLPAGAPGAGRADLAAAATAGAAAPGWSLPAPPDPWPLVLLTLLAAVAAVRLGTLVRDLGELRRLKEEALPLPPGRVDELREVLGVAPLRGARLGFSRRATTPITVGFRRPMILLPERLLPGLAEAELRQIVLHELAHLRRRDDWTNLGQRILEAALFFHPVVRWIGNRLELEREIACDDQVVAALAGSREYARCLTRLAELAVASRKASLAPGAAPGASQLARRVGALLAPDRPRGLRVSAGAAAVALALLAGGAAGLHRAAPGIALTVERAALLPTLAAMRAAPAPSPAAAAVPEAARAAPRAARPASAGETRPPALPAVREPEPRVVALVEAPEIVESASVAKRPARSQRVARGPAPPLERRQAAPRVEVTLSLPFAAGEAVVLGSREDHRRPDGWTAPDARPAGLGGFLRRGFRFRVLGGGHDRRPYHALPGRP